jgi:hypothetical protein
MFVASPGDVAEEREIARSVIQALPQDPLLRGKVTTDVVTWDGPGGVAMEATMVPQEAIKTGLPRPSECDIVVLIAWLRMGTPLAPDWERKPDGSPYRSGTEWEFLDALGAAKREGKPAILVYRRSEKWTADPDAPDFEEKLAQYKQVQAFFAEFRNREDGSFKGSYNEYRNPPEFKTVLERDLKALIGKRLESEIALREQKPPSPERAWARTELTRLGMLILRLHYVKSMAGILHGLYTNPSVRQLRSEAAGEVPAGILGKVLACTESAVSSIQSAISDESYQLLASTNQVSSVEDDFGRLKAVAASLSVLVDESSARDHDQPNKLAAEVKKINRYFNSVLRDWRDKLNRDAEERWDQLGLRDFGAKMEPLRPYLSRPYISRFDKGYAELTGQPPLFEKCDLLAREHDLLQDVLKQFDMLQGELDIGDLDQDELQTRCEILKALVAQAQGFWSRYLGLSGTREKWEDTLLSSGGHQWDIINKCQQDMTDRIEQIINPAAAAGFGERMRKAQRNLELHFGTVDDALAQAFGKVRQAIGETLLKADLAIEVSDG